MKYFRHKVAYTVVCTKESQTKRKRRKTNSQTPGTAASNIIEIISNVVLSIVKKNYLFCNFAPSRAYSFVIFFKKVLVGKNSHAYTVRKFN